MQEHLIVSNLDKSFPPATDKVVDGVSFRVQPGEMFVLLGPSGCGKTTTLRMIGGFAAPDQGEIQLDTQTLSGPTHFLPPNQRDIGFVFQDYALFPHLSVADNIGFGLAHLARSARRETVEQMLTLVGLLPLKERMPQQLSGGEQQRVALARALARNPKLLLLDEPFSNLDELRREQMRTELKQLLKERGISSILVTHHQEEAMMMADRIAIMKQGKIQQIGPPEQLYQHPHNAFVAGFLGRTNLLQGVAEGTSANTLLGQLTLNQEASGPVQLSLRPEQITLSSPSHTEGEVIVTLRECFYKGAYSLLQVEREGQLFWVMQQGAPKGSPGTQYAAHITSNAARLK